MNDNKENIENSTEQIETLEEFDEKPTEIIDPVRDDGQEKEDLNSFDNVDIPNENDTTSSIDTYNDVDSSNQMNIPDSIDTIGTTDMGDSDYMLDSPSTNDTGKKEKASKPYVDYSIRLVGHMLVLLTLAILSTIFLQGALSEAPVKTIGYKEGSSVDYKVYLKPNDFYDQPFLGKDKVYVASMIDNVLIDFRYNFNIAELTKMDFEYEVVARLTINDEVTGGNYYEKEYVILDKQKSTLDDNTFYTLNQQVKIDYGYYNNLANDFRQQYGVNSESNLTVYLRINKKNDIPEITKPVDTSTMFVKIPLSEKTINIELNYQDINNSSYIVEKDTDVTGNIVFAVISLVCMAATVIVAVKTVKLLTLLNGNKSAYDKYIEKILSEYDRLIVENSTGPDLAKNNVIKISKFEELLDVRDNLKLPIMYYVVSKHNKCYFYIKHSRDLYLMTIKAVDLENAGKEKK